MLGTLYDNNQPAVPVLDLSDSDFFNVSPNRSNLISPQPQYVSQAVNALLDYDQINSLLSQNSSDSSSSPSPILSGRVSAITDNLNVADEPLVIDQLDIDDSVDDTPIPQRSPSASSINSTPDFISRLPINMQQKIEQLRLERIARDQLLQDTQKKSAALDVKKDKYKEKIHTLKEENACMRTRMNEMEEIFDKQTEQIIRLNAQLQDQARVFERATSHIATRQNRTESEMNSVNYKSWAVLGVSIAAVAAGILVVYVKFIRK